MSYRPLASGLPGSAPGAGRVSIDRSGCLSKRVCVPTDMREKITPPATAKKRGRGAGAAARRDANPRPRRAAAAGRAVSSPRAGSRGVGLRWRPRRRRLRTQVASLVNFLRSKSITEHAKTEAWPNQAARVVKNNYAQKAYKRSIYAAMACSMPRQD